VHAGTITAVMGRNGSGKSSLLGALAGAHEPSLGRISYPDADLPAARPSRWSRRRDRTDDATAPVEPARARPTRPAAQ